MNDLRACQRRITLLAALLALSAPADATRQCPPEFGTKNPLVDVSGWLVVAVGLLLGGWLFRFVVRRSRGQRWFVRMAAIVSGFAAAVLAGIGGFALAFALFFFRC